METILSVIAIIISIIVAVIYALQYRQIMRVNKINLKSEFFVELFKGYLIEELPSKRNCILIVKSDFDPDLRVMDQRYRNFTDILREMLKKMQFFYYMDREFYDKLKNCIVQLEEDIIKMVGKENISSSEEGTFQSDVDRGVMKIYDCIFGYYLGVKKK